ncbi:MAG TPA: class I SAM-dependent rRNA methyltransferase [Ignavibacteria bacterium]|nr:class I SAM-dependent rRNA methyltransferase [Ignavibacteria bacterium]
MAKVFLKKNEERRILNGHYWVFSNEVESIEQGIETGDLAEAYSSKGECLGTGFYNKNSLITLRLLKKPFGGDLAGYLKDSILRALNFRDNIYSGRTSYRLVFSESDYLPGLIIDKYNNTFVLQVYSAGMQKNLNIITDVLKNDLAAINIFTKNDPHLRRMEGLPEADEVIFGETGTEIINDGKISYNIDFSTSQKTGFYFDQSDNREFIEKFSSGKSVLDAFCNSGGFGMHAAYAGAKEVLFVESSNTEIENAKSNYLLNKLNAETEFIKSDVFDYLEKCAGENKKFDIVIVDPPAFAKNRKSIATASKGYTKLNKLALSCVNKNGYLVTSSCSYHIKEQDFSQLVINAAGKAGRNIQLIYKNGASLDHPQIPAMDETAYLKFMVFKVS